MEFKRGEVFYIHKMATTGSEQESGRPGIIVSNDTNNAYSPVVEVVYLTTQPKKDLPTHVSIRSTGVPSTALCEQITTVSIDRIGSYAGTCTEEEMERIEYCMMVSLGMSADAYEPDEDSCEDDCDDVNVNDEELMELRTEITKLQAERDVYKQLYTDMISKLIR